MAITLENRKQKTETGKKPEAGFALLVAVIFMSVMLSFGLALGSLGYKQQILSSGAIASQYAFYVADTALECALYADQQQNLFAYEKYDGNPKSLTCSGQTVAVIQRPPSVSELISTVRLSLDSDTHCADVTVYKSPLTGATYLFSQGYDVSCERVAEATARFVSRGLSIRYGSISGSTMNNGVCALSHYDCAVGTSANTVEGETSYTWSCISPNGGTTASCSETKSSPPPPPPPPPPVGEMSLVGYAWSSNIGWIGFSGPGYSVSEDTTTGALSGYAWSSNIGWISFNASDGTHPAPQANFTTGNVSGWARACAAFTDKIACSGALAGSWDGWISLRGTALDGSVYGITQNSSCVWSGYAWGSDSIGAISVKGTAADGSPYGVVGSDPTACYPH